jgi:hypothetical protein
MKYIHQFATRQEGVGYSTAIYLSDDRVDEMQIIETMKDFASKSDFFPPKDKVYKIKKALKYADKDFEHSTISLYSERYAIVYLGDLRIDAMNKYWKIK